MLDAGEACDDGSPGGDDCCSVACTFVASGVACADTNACTLSECDGAGACVVAENLPADTPCELDTDVCTLDRCDGAGTCAQAGTVTCAPCRSCNAMSGLCIPAPATGCHRPNVAGGSRVLLRPDKLVWRWGKGDTDSNEFGDPAVTDDYTLCFFEDVDYVPQPIFGATLPAGGTCGGADCWTPRGNPLGSRGYRYRDSTLSQRGLQTLLLKPGDNGRARIIAKGKGPGLTLSPPLDVELTLLVQLQREGGACWEATYTDFIASEYSLFKAKSAP